jgi:endo-1,4-beta-D-glucanase Y
MIPLSRGLSPWRDAIAKYAKPSRFKHVRAARSVTLLAGILLGVVGTVHSQVQPWNLPYVRPANYNYSTLYAANLNTYLSVKPDFFKARLQGAWTYWKANFISSNGLVNHRRLENNSIIGTNEAVSEGQGYGMLLSVLLNDQTTFNKIFEAANSNLWDGGKKSYRWTWPNGSAGAATDADLDICLALVFADELQKAHLWQAYSSGGLTYNSRAMDMMRSIKNNMTSSNYLLPGDTWGGEGVNNLNPSYFATAWFKVFNAYQKEVDFTAVIDNCYAVLAKMPRYSFGQGPDWCTASGGQASQAGGKAEQGLGMLSDGIRVPYRIGMDALWFKDARAITYCKNTQKTVTDYNNPSYNLAAAEMAQYSKSGVATTESKGSFDNMAMWMTAILGSGDVTYTQGGMRSELFARIVGTLDTYLGTNELRDDVFYYKQSIAMLGLAALGGQFPNIQADVKTPVGIYLAPKSRPAGNLMEKLLPGGTQGYLNPNDAFGRSNYRDALGRNGITVLP